jgi:hypothetical protein
LTAEDGPIKSTADFPCASSLLIELSLRLSSDWWAVPALASADENDEGGAEEEVTAEANCFDLTVLYSSYLLERQSRMQSSSSSSSTTTAAAGAGAGAGVTVETVAVLGGVVMAASFFVLLPEKKELGKSS